MNDLAKTNQELMNVKELPNLHELEPSPREMSSEYWTPEEHGEYKVGVVAEIKEESYTNEETGETIQLPCIIMLSQEKDGSFNTIRNGSKRLVATVEAAANSGEIEFGRTPIRITFVGKKRNKTNAFSSDRWSVKALVL